MSLGEAGLCGAGVTGLGGGGLAGVTGLGGGGGLAFTTAAFNLPMDGEVGLAEATDGTGVTGRGLFAAACVATEANLPVGDGVDEAAAGLEGGGTGLGEACLAGVEEAAENGLAGGGGGGGGPAERGDEAPPVPTAGGACWPPGRGDCALPLPAKISAARLAASAAFNKRAFSAGAFLCITSASACFILAASASTI